jgi:hypothetical protein
LLLQLRLLHKAEPISKYSTVILLTLLLLLLLLLLQEVKPIIWASEYSKYKAEQKKNGKQ